MFEKGHKKLGGRKKGLVIPKHNYNWVCRDQIFVVCECKYKFLKNTYSFKLVDIGPPNNTKKF